MAETRPPVSPRYEEGRRLWSAGHAIVVCALALSFGLLLNAPGVHKKAYNGEAGWRRDLATAITGPLASFSHGLRLDRPRSALQTAIGRSGADRIDTDLRIAVPGLQPVPGDRTPLSIVRGPKSTTPERVTEADPVKPAFTPKRKLRIWIAGDSLVITPGYAIRRAAAKTQVAEGISVDGRIGTGLGRPDVFNWFSHLRSELRALRPGVVVLAFGGNDDKAFMTGVPDGTTIGEFGGVAWRREYRRRVAGVLDIAARAGAHAVWIGLPQTADAGQTRRYRVVNSVVAAEARQRTGKVTFVDTFALLTGPDGQYAQYVKNPRGRLVRVRAADGVHFEREGGDVIARVVVKALGRTYDLTSWKQKRQVASAAASARAGRADPSSSSRTPPR